LISRITVQICRQPGLSIVHTERLNFGGDGVYFKDEPAFAGKTLGYALLAYAESTVIGLQTKDGARVNPLMDTRVASCDTPRVSCSQEVNREHLSASPRTD
jgi:hypothetical protein